ncbi:hypothetical protein TNCV_537291 [Trichonephila clavipes]|nr:hypothetical protein TNCV_537291 [Trichonephila clavipes]
MQCGFYQLSSVANGKARVDHKHDLKDIMPSGLTVHRVLIAPRDSILQNVETVIQCSTWPLHHWRSPRGIQTHRFFISREIYCIEQLRLYGAEDCDVMLQWTVVLDLEFDDGRRTVELLSWLQLQNYM